MKTNNIIDLENYRTQLGSVKSRVFTGRDRGEDVRKRSNVNKIFDDNDIVVVKIPSDVYSIKKYGKDRFLQMIQWETNGYNIEGPLDEAIDRIINDKTGLD